LQLVLGYAFSAALMVFAFACTHMHRVLASAEQVNSYAAACCRLALGSIDGASFFHG